MEVGNSSVVYGVSPKRQNELTRRIQRRLRDAVGKNGKGRILQSPVSMSAAPAVEHVLSIEGNRATYNIASPSFLTRGDGVPATTPQHQLRSLGANGTPS